MKRLKANPIFQAKLKPGQTGKMVLRRTTIDDVLFDASELVASNRQRGENSATLSKFGEQDRARTKVVTELKKLEKLFTSTNDPRLLWINHLHKNPFFKDKLWKSAKANALMDQSPSSPFREIIDGLRNNKLPINPKQLSELIKKVQLLRAAKNKRPLTEKQSEQFIERLITASRRSSNVRTHPKK